MNYMIILSGLFLLVMLLVVVIYSVRAMIEISKSTAEKELDSNDYIIKSKSSKKVHLKTVYIPSPITKNIEDIVTSVCDSEHKKGYSFNDVNYTKVENGVVLFMRFTLFKED